MPPVRVEPMREADVAEAAALDGTAAFDERELWAELARPGSLLWVARSSDGGTPEGAGAGGATAGGSSSPPRAFLSVWHVADELHILNLVTHPEHRRRGLARALMNELLAYARSHGARRLLLEVRRSNDPALALYRSLSFVVVGVRARYYRDDEDALEMALALAPDGAVVPAEGEVAIEREPRDE
jgi:ribosomal protein S18 acetylase RimI-like enzyme